MLLDSIIDLSFYKTAFIIKTIINIICIITPIVIIIKTTIDILSSINNDNKIKIIPLILFKRILIGIIIFMIPTLLINIINILTDENIKKNNYFTYYKDASIKKIAEVQNIVNREEEERINLEKAQSQEALKVKAETPKITHQQSEETNDNNDNDNRNDDQNNDDDNVIDPESGETTSGKVTVKNGVFYIPNKRATSNADTPKQSGKYGLNPVFWERLNKFITDASKQGYKITVSSALRTYSQQAKLWNNSSRACSERSKWVACPGGSRHGWGIAADLKYNGKSCNQSNWNCNAAARWAHENASKYQLKYRMKWEPWHIEPAQVKGGSYGKCTAKC